MLAAARRFVLRLSATRSTPVSSFTRPFSDQSGSSAGSVSKELGTVKWFDPSKGFGFITKSSGEELFVHFTSIRGAGYRTLEEGQKVEFRIGAGQKGPVAQDVSVKQ